MPQPATSTSRASAGGKRREKAARGHAAQIVLDGERLGDAGRMHPARIRVFLVLRLHPSRDVVVDRGQARDRDRAPRSCTGSRSCCVTTASMAAGHGRAEQGFASGTHAAAVHREGSKRRGETRARTMHRLAKRRGELSDACVFCGARRENIFVDEALPRAWRTKPDNAHRLRAWRRREQFCAQQSEQAFERNIAHRGRLQDRKQQRILGDRVKAAAEQLNRPVCGCGQAVGRFAHGLADRRQDRGQRRADAAKWSNSCGISTSALGKVRPRPRAICPAPAARRQVRCGLARVRASAPAGACRCARHRRGGAAAAVHRFGEQLRRRAGMRAAGWPALIARGAALFSDSSAGTKGAGASAIFGQDRGRFCAVVLPMRRVSGISAAMAMETWPSG